MYANCEGHVHRKTGHEGRKARLLVEPTSLMATFASFLSSLGLFFSFPLSLRITVSPSCTPRIQGYWCTTEIISIQHTPYFRSLHSLTTSRLRRTHAWAPRIANSPQTPPTCPIANTTPKAPQGPRSLARSPHRARASRRSFDRQAPWTRRSAIRG